MSFRSVLLTELEIRDERTFRPVALYARLKDRLVRDAYRFALAAPEGENEDWARVLFLNLTYWNGEEAHDLLAEDAIDADVVAHVAWHHAVGALWAEPGVARSADALLFGEAVASAFDLYLLGRVFGRVEDSSFLESAVPGLTEAALSAGLGEDEVEALFQTVVADPEAAFESLRALLFDLTTALVRCTNAAQAAAVLDAVGAHPFAPFLHHYELSNWVLYAQAHGSTRAPQPAVRALDAELRAAPISLDLLADRCLGPDEA
jgi:hypothetical protein